MFEFLKLQYRMHKITRSELRAKVPKYINAAQYKMITGEEY